jgi:hypothetical protein
MRHPLLDVLVLLFFFFYCGCPGQLTCISTNLPETLKLMTR